MYVCGPTVYKPSHVGHMVGPVIFDTVKRYLTYLGYQVTWVVNITDVDDKLIVRAPELGTTVKELAEQMTADYLDCLKKLNVTGIDQMPRATEHIADMIEMMRGLIDKGYAYPAGGDVYFDVSKDARLRQAVQPRPGAAGGRRRASRSATSKRNPGDFALWKGAKPGEPAWDSPWGPGRPGWHIECSAMSMKLPRQDARHPRRRPRPAVPAPRERAGPVGVVHRPAVRALLDAQRPAEDGQRRRWPARSATSSTSSIC